MKRYRFNGLDIDIPKTGEYVRVEEVMAMLQALYDEFTLSVVDSVSAYVALYGVRSAMRKIQESDIVDVSEEEHK